MGTRPIKEKAKGQGGWIEQETKPNPELWQIYSDQQVYLTALSRTSPSTGPAIAFTGLIPDLDHYNGRGGRVLSLWRDKDASIPNLPPKLLPFLAQKYGMEVSAEDLMAYIAAIAAHPAFTARFQEDLATPGLRIPLISDRNTFTKAAELGRTVIWLHTFGERMVDPQKGRPAQPPRLPPTRKPHIPAAGAIPQEPEAMPDSINCDANKKDCSSVKDTWITSNPESGAMRFQANKYFRNGLAAGGQTGNVRSLATGGLHRRWVMYNLITGSPNTQPS